MRIYTSTTYVKGMYTHIHENGLEKWHCSIKHGKSEWIKQLKIFLTLGVWTATLVVATFYSIRS